MSKMPEAKRDETPCPHHLYPTFDCSVCVNQVRDRSFNHGAYTQRELLEGWVPLPSVEEMTKMISEAEEGYKLSYEEVGRMARRLLIRLQEER